VKTALLFSYEVARGGTPCEEADLVIEGVPEAAYCRTCRRPRGVVSVQQLHCSECGTPTDFVMTGQELEVVGLEIQ
jgi:hydrogenase nickel incorporation protein HypA/HybF